MKFCPNCGAEVSDDDMFCLRCGRPLRNRDAADMETTGDHDADAEGHGITAAVASADRGAQSGTGKASASEVCCRYGFRAIGLGIIAGILVIFAFAYQSTATVDLAAGGLHFGVNSGNDTLSLLDIGFGGLGCEYYIPTFVVLFLAVLSLYSPVSGVAGSIAGLVVAVYLDSIVFTSDGRSSGLLPGLDELDSGISASLELDDIGFICLVLAAALVLSIVGSWYLHRASVLSGTDGMMETQIKAWRNRFRCDAEQERASALPLNRIPAIGSR